MDQDLIWWVGQVIGFIALLLGRSAFAQKSDLQFKRKMTLFCLIEAIHFAFLTAWSASFGCLVNSCRSFASTRTRSKIVMFFFLALLWSIGVLAIVNFNSTLLVTTYHDQHLWGLLKLLFKEPFRFLPLLGSTIGTIGLFLLTGLRLRYAVFTCSFLWFIHNVIVISIGPSIMEAVFMYTNYKTILSLKKEQKK